jgi:hydrogenase maturation protein HypF
MKSMSQRINYSFINCTNCGPRFSIIKELPYDRKNTTMHKFKMCKKCEKEYANISDRRFHAQPNACEKCGPQYELHYDNKVSINIDQILDEMATLLEKDKIVAIKGLGGFHLACNALNNVAVEKLREIKNRDKKPFAIMFPNLEVLAQYAELNNKEKELLTSLKRPIVLLKIKKHLAEAVTYGIDTIGAMLPYLPFHYLLFNKTKLPAIVLTSGNISDEPIIINNEEAKSRLLEFIDGILIHDRDIHNRNDDSVINVVNNSERIIRRSRGYVPEVIKTTLNVEGIIATGAELKNCFCIGKDNEMILSQHIGDLKNIETFIFFQEAIERFKKLFRIKPSVIAYDLHPDYLSSQYSQKYNLTKIGIQHHHAHIASCMAEHNLDENVIGICFDGTGFGEDRNIWGGEFMIANLADYQRISYFDYVPMPGGEKAIKEPWRMAIAYLYKTFGSSFSEIEIPFLKQLNKESVGLLVAAINKSVNTPLTSSVGRLFDAVAAVIGLCLVNNFEAEAPMKLESIINEKIDTKYSYNFNKTIDTAPIIREIVLDLNNNIDISIISAKFHNTIIDIILEMAKIIRKDYKINKIILSGGVFQNRFLLSRTENTLIDNNFDVFTHSKIPSNDGGIALGQIIIAAKRRMLKCV